LNKSDSAAGEVFWKCVYVIFCVILLCLTAVQLFSFVLSDPHSGWDYQVYKGAVQSLNHGEDPYYLLNINQYTGEWLPYNYPPHTLLFFWCLQFLFIFQTLWAYYASLFVLMVISGYLIVRLDEKPEYLFLITLLLIVCIQMIASDCFVNPFIKNYQENIEKQGYVVAASITSQTGFRHQTVMKTLEQLASEYGWDRRQDRETKSPKYMPRAKPAEGSSQAS
jgi:hypothetical protein